MYILGHNRKGQHHTIDGLANLKIAQNEPEFRKQRSLAKIEFYKDPENRKKHKDACNTPEAKANNSDRMQTYYENPDNLLKHKMAYNSLEVRERMSDSQIEAQNRPEVKEHKKQTAKQVWERDGYKEKMSKIQTAAHNTKEFLENHSELMKIVMNDPEVKEKTSRASKIAHDKPEVKEKTSMSVKKLWQDPEYVRKQQEARHLFPNNPETGLFNFLQVLYIDHYRYCGDFSFVINGKNPDFVNINGQKKCIELYGDYWHKGQDPQDRINIFKEYGWDCLVVWEHELKDIEKLKFKIIEFHERPQPKQAKEILDGKA